MSSPDQPSDLDSQFGSELSELSPPPSPLEGSKKGGQLSSPLSKARRDFLSDQESHHKPAVVRTYGRANRRNSLKASLPPTIKSSPPRPLSVGKDIPTSSPRKRTGKKLKEAGPSKRPRIAAEEQRDSSPTRRSSRPSKGALVFPTPTKPKTPTKVPRPKKGREDAAEPSSSLNADAWSPQGLGRLVWLRIKDDGGVVDDVEAVATSYWWPSKITSDTDATEDLQVSLFHPPPFSSSQAIDLRSPQPFNILPLRNAQGQQQFNPTSYFSKLSTKSPSKSVQSAWLKAVAELNKEDTHLNDGLPGTISAILLHTSTNGHNDTPSHTPSHSRKKSALSRTSGSNLRWSPPPPDRMLSIPGELVLSRVKKNLTEHWPAKILEYVPPTSESQPAKYLLRFLDDKKIAVTRDLFLTAEDEGFGTCKMGTFDSWRQDNENDHPDDTDVFASIPPDDPWLSCDPALSPAPSTELRFKPIGEQFTYTKPVLRAILQGNYEPALQRHNDFFKGGKRRAAVCKTAGAQGDLTAPEVEQLAAYICRWAGVSVRRTPPVEENKTEVMEVDTKEVPNGDTNGTPEGQTNGVEKSPDAEEEPSGKEPIENAEEIPAPAETQPVSTDKTNAGGSDNDNKAEPDQTEAIQDEFCQEYQNLSDAEKLEYCLNVLLTEAIIQLLLWRSGERNSVDLLSKEEEVDLRRRGKDKTLEGDFVHDVVRLRRLKESGTRPAPTPSDTGAEESLSRRTRQKKSAATK